MFKKFFSWIITTAKNYIKTNGIVKTVCNAIQGVAVAAGAFAVLATAFKRIKAKLMIKWELRKTKKRYYSAGVYKKSEDDPNAYDENGYRLTSSEYYDQNKKNFELTEKLYTDENMQCVKFIEMYEPHIFKGMDMDHKLMYIDKNGITFDDLVFKYGHDKDSQVKKYLAETTGVPVDQITNEQLQEFWNEGESNKIGIGSKVNQGYVKPKSKKKQAKQKMIQFFTPKDYAEMEEKFGVDKFYTMDPTKFDPILADRRKRFDDCVEYASGFMNWLYVHNRDELKRNLNICHNDPVLLWKIYVTTYMTDDSIFEQIKKDFSGKLGLLGSEAKGHRTSSRPAITTLEEAKYIDKIETLLDKLNDIDMLNKCNIPPEVVEEDDDEDESIDIFEEDDDDDFDDDAIPTFDDDSILDQLDALREGRDPNAEIEPPKMVSPVDETTPMIKQPVKLIQKFDDEPEDDPDEPSRVLYMNPVEYTTKNRANRLLNMYEKWHKEDGREYADMALLTMLSDENHENFKIYEGSLEMKARRQADRAHQLPFKLVPTDYTDKDDRRNAVAQFEEAMKICGAKNWKDMIDQRMEYHYTFFEVDTADKMMEALAEHHMDHDIKIDLIRMFVNSGYEDCVERVDSIYEYYKEALTLPEGVIQAYMIDDNMNEYAATELPEV